jgi:hypothetical protein
VNTFKTFVLAGAICISLSSCGQNSSDQSSPTSSTEPTSVAEAVWNDSAIVKSILSQDVIESWGYKKGTGTTSIDSFTSDKNGLVETDAVAIEPANCKIIRSMLVLSGDLNASHYAQQIHTEDFGISYNDFSVIYYFFETDSSAQEQFAEIRSNIGSCGSWSRLKDGNLIETKLWNEPTQVEPNLISGTDGDGIANAFGINGSVIYSVQVITTDKEGTVEETINLAVSEINVSLDAAQR